MQKNLGMYRRGKRLALIPDAYVKSAVLRAITELWHKPTIDKHQPHGIDLQRQRITLCGADSRTLLDKLAMG